MGVLLAPPYMTLFIFLLFIIPIYIIFCCSTIAPPSSQFGAYFYIPLYIRECLVCIYFSLTFTLSFIDFITYMCMVGLQQWPRRDRRAKRLLG